MFEGPDQVSATATVDRWPPETTADGGVEAELVRRLAGVLAEALGVSRVEPTSHFFDDLGANSLVMAKFCARVRKTGDLPPVSIRDIYATPTIASLAAALAPSAADELSDAAPAVEVAVEAALAEAVLSQRLAGVLAEALGVSRVEPTSHFFDDLGANSLVMAKFCARVRKTGDLPPVSIRDIYATPTIASLAAALAPSPAPSQAPSQDGVSTTARTPRVAGDSAGVDAVPTRALADVSPGARRATAQEQTSSARYIACGAAQALIFVGYSYLAVVAGVWGYDWVLGGSGLVEGYLRAVVFGGAALVAVCTFPVVAKWVLVGRWRATSFPLWGPAYLRLWVVKALLHANPMVLFVGNPLYVFYLRALGAKIGPGVTILSHSVPVCTDLISIGAGTVVRKDSVFSGYRAHDGRIETGPVTIGRDAFVGEKTVLDIDTALGDGAQLGHTSALQRGESVPAREHWHGSPAERTDVDYVRVAPAECGAARRAWFVVASLLQVFLLNVPLLVGATYLMDEQIPSWIGGLRPGAQLTTSGLLLDALLFASVAFFGFVLGGLVFVCTVPRLVNALTEPDRVYPLYGFHYSLHRTVIRVTNIKIFLWLFGNSSYIVGFLHRLGYQVSRAENTGSNFGDEVSHETPYLVTVGAGTMVADGLSIVNADYSSTSFRVSRATIGAHSFLGNNIAYPSGARVGENCLLATKVGVPLDGKMREGVGLLGSPAFEIPRSVERDSRFDSFRTGESLAQGLRRKNRHNLRTMVLMLGVRWGYAVALTTFSLATLNVSTASVLSVLLPPMLMVFSAGYFVLVERLICLFGRLEPQVCSNYDPYFWWHERLWKVPDSFLNAFNGTPFKSVVWRLMGVRIGKRVFDDGAYVTERTLTTIGDDCTLNVGSKVQCHSQEDGTFKSDHTVIGSGVTLGVGAFVHYGVQIGDNAVLAADSFLMKGEEVPAATRWLGNPATPERTRRPAPIPARVAVPAARGGDHDRLH